MRYWSASKWPSAWNAGMARISSRTRAGGMPMPRRSLASSSTCSLTSWSSTCWRTSGRSKNEPSSAPLDICIMRWRYWLKRSRNWSWLISWSPTFATVVLVVATKYDSRPKNENATTTRPRTILTSRPDFFPRRSCSMDGNLSDERRANTRRNETRFYAAARTVDCGCREKNEGAAGAPRWFAEGGPASSRVAAATGWPPVCQPPCSALAARRHRRASWWVLRVSNPRPSPCKGDALPLS